jgi:uncharacterized protein (DUF1330 family)
MLAAATQELRRINHEDSVMNTKFKFALAVTVGAALGAAAVQGLHAQGKPKAWAVIETEVIDAAAVPAFVPLAQAALKAAGGRVFNTGGGMTVALVGEAPKRVAINEFDSLEQAQAFYNSAAWKDLAPQRSKALKVVRQYIVSGAN